jgi:tetratricopeptide (TPR) repeat protein
MDSRRFVTNLVFACVVALLALTAATFVFNNSKQPENPDYLKQMGNRYYDLGQYEKAVDFYRQSLSIRPRDPSVETDLATCYHNLNQEDKALEILNKVLEYSPGFSQAMFNKGIVLIYGKKNTIDGIKVWEDLLQSDPNFQHKAEIEEKIRQLRGSSR